jgi:PPIC-type PPIASE domain/SurA-like N-terminal domain
MAKRPASDAQGLTRRQSSRARREARLQRSILIGAGILAVVIVGVIAYGFIDLQYLKPNRAVATVLDAKITGTEFMNQVIVDNYLQFGGQIPLSAYGMDANSYSKFTLDSMIDDLVVEQKAKEKGLTVTDQELERGVGLAFGYDAGTPEPTSTPTATPKSPRGSPTATSTFVYTLTPLPTGTLAPGETPTLTPNPQTTAGSTPTGAAPATITPTPSPQPTSTPLTAAAYNANFNDFLTRATAATGLTADQVKTAWYFRVRASLYRKKLVEALNIQPDKDKTMTHAAHILVGTQDEANKLLDRIKAGEKFEKLAALSSTDTGSAYKGGDLGWFGPGVMDQTFADAALKVPVGQISEPVQTQFGWHLIKVYDRQTVPTTTSDQDQQVRDKLTALIAQWRTDYNVVTDDSWTEFVPAIQ